MTGAEGGVTLANVSAGPGRIRLLHGVSFSARPGEVTVLVGPNGSGKSTVLRTLLRATRREGDVYVGGTDVNDTPPGRRVELLAVLTQEHEASPGTRARDVVVLGRAARHGALGRMTAEDEHHVAAAMDRMDLHGLAGRDLVTLSGGERQRTQIARVLAQDAQVVVMDEPTNHLDVCHQHSVLQVLHDLAHTHGKTVLVALHDLALAARWADQVVVLEAGRVVAAGDPERTLTPALIATRFRVPAAWTTLDGRRRLVVG